ncbi:unnamed protein product [Urochloa humidicola]
MRICKPTGMANAICSGSSCSAKEQHHVLPLLRWSKGDEPHLRQREIDHGYSRNGHIRGQLAGFAVPA